MLGARIGAQHVAVLQPTDPQVGDPRTLVLVISARVTRASDLVPGSNGYVMALQLQPVRRIAPSLPPITPGTPFLVHAAEVSELVAAARDNEILAAMMRDGVGI